MRELGRDLSLQQEGWVGSRGEPVSQTFPLLPGKLQSWELELWRERFRRWGMQPPGAHP